MNVGRNKFNDVNVASDAVNGAFGTISMLEKTHYLVLWLPSCLRCVIGQGETYFGELKYFGLFWPVNKQLQTGMSKVLD